MPPLQASQPRKPITDSDGYTYKDITDRLLGRKEETGRNRAIGYAKGLGCDSRGVKNFIEAYDAAAKASEGINARNLNAGRRAVGISTPAFGRPRPPGGAGLPAAVAPSPAAVHPAH